MLGMRTQTLLRAIEVGLAAVGMSPSRFGREVAGDPRLVFDVRRGRQLQTRTELRVRNYLTALRQQESAT